MIFNQRVNNDTEHFMRTHTTMAARVDVLQAAGPAEGVVGIAGGAAGSGLGAEVRAERFPAGEDSVGGGAQLPEGIKPKPGPQQRSTHQPVPGMS